MAKVKTGDIVEIITSRGLVYAQYTHKHKDYGSLLRVFETGYENRPKCIDNIVKEKLQFAIFFPLQAAIKQNLISVIGNCAVPKELADFPMFRAGAINPNIGKVATWWLWDGKKETKIGKLSNEQRKLPIRGICNDTLLIEKIETYWTAEDDPIWQ